jgi:hypothetical protein
MLNINSFDFRKHGSEAIVGSAAIVMNDCFQRGGV